MCKTRHCTGVFGILAIYLLTCATVAYGQRAFYPPGLTRTEEQNYFSAAIAIYVEHKPRSKRRHAEPQLTEIQLQTWDLATAQWQDHLRITSLYNAAGNVLERLASRSEGGTWTDYFRVTYAYDNGEDRTRILYQGWDVQAGAWKNDAQVSYTYADDNPCYVVGEWQERLNKRWDEVQGWVNSDRVSVTYDADCIQTHLIESWTSQAGQWKATYGSIIRVNKYGLPLEVTNHIWDETQQVWRPMMRNEYTYSGQGALDTHIAQKMLDPAQGWINELRYHNTNYDVREPIEERHLAFWDNKKKTWVDDCQVYATYDAMGNVETVTTERYWSYPGDLIENSWRDIDRMSERKMLTYDEHGLNTERQYYRWYAEAATWLPDRRVQYTYARVNTESETPTAFVLSEVYPNPFSTRATVSLTLDRAQSVKVNVFNILGQHVASLHSGMMQADVQHHLTFDGTALPSGTYWIRIDGETASYTRSAVLVK